jgi:hypothetical protein
MMTEQARESTRGTMQPERELSEEQLREIADRAHLQAREYYDLADKVRLGAHTNDVGYQRAVDRYFCKDGRRID